MPGPISEKIVCFCVSVRILEALTFSIASMIGTRSNTVFNICASLLRWIRLTAFLEALVGLMLQVASAAAADVLLLQLALAS